MSWQEIVEFKGQLWWKAYNIALDAVVLYSLNSTAHCSFPSTAQYQNNSSLWRLVGFRLGSRVLLVEGGEFVSYSNGYHERYALAFLTDHGGIPYSKIEEALQNGIHRRAQAPNHSGPSQTSSPTASGATAQQAASQANALVAAQQAAIQSGLAGSVQVQRAINAAAMFQGALGPPAKPQAPPPHEGIQVGEILAWRCWKLSSFWLTSTYMDSQRWPHEEPLEGNPAKADEGIHAFKELAGVQRYIKAYFGAPSCVLIIGQVWLWGEVVEHETGYRAEFAKPASLVQMLPSYDPDILPSLAKLYSCSTEPLLAAK